MKGPRNERRRKKKRRFARTGVRAIRSQEAEFAYGQAEGKNAERPGKRIAVGTADSIVPLPLTVTGFNCA
jgi:hypothetical protein